jgi:hypothetical protein
MATTAAVLGKLVLDDYKPFVPIVGEAYVARPAFEASAEASWRVLMEHVERLYQRMIARIRVEFVSRDPYPDAEDLERDIRENRRMRVYTGDSDHPVWSPGENWRFRAVHDYMSHLAGGHAFTLRGEMSAYNRHVKLAPPAARPALFVEIVGQTCTYFYLDKKFTAQKVCHLYGFDYVNVGLVNRYEWEKNFE